MLKLLHTGVVNYFCADKYCVVKLMNGAGYALYFEYVHNEHRIPLDPNDKVWRCSPDEYHNTMNVNDINWKELKTSF